MAGQGTVFTGHNGVLFEGLAGAASIFQCQTARDST
jgi:hypothetical protein